MKDFRTLQILDRFQPVFVKMGVDYPIMRKILAVKLTLDQRKVATIFSGQAGRRKKGPEENGFVKSLWMYVLLGLMLIPFVTVEANLLISLSFFFGIVLFFVMMSMVSDFSSVLLDLRDKVILETRPVDKRTISMAKGIHVSIYLFFLTAALTAIPLVVGLLNQGIFFFLLMIIELILVNLFVIVLTSMVYYLILRFFDGEKVKDVINLVQIGFVIAITVGYQFLGQTFRLIDSQSQFTAKWWQLFIPPIWFSSLADLLLQQNYQLPIIAFSLLALIIPIAGMAVFATLMPSFERNLQKLAWAGGNGKTSARRWENRIVPILCWTKEEQAFYRFSMQMMSNEREFRLKVYPSIGLALIFPFIVIMNRLQIDSYASLIASKWYFMIYFSNLVIPGTMMMLKYSGNYQGSWIFATAPLKNFEPFYRAALKAFIVKLFVPIYVILSVIFVVMFGVNIIPDLLIAFAASVLFTLICSIVLKGTVPFSEAFRAAQQSDLFRNIVLLIPILLLGVLHYFATSVSWGRPMYVALLLIVLVIAWRKMFRTF